MNAGRGGRGGNPSPSPPRPGLAATSGVLAKVRRGSVASRLVLAGAGHRRVYQNTHLIMPRVVVAHSR